MHPVIAPKISQWYQDIAKDEIFKVVAKSAVGDFIEIQYFSGEIAELDFDTWFSLQLSRIPAPEDSSGPFDRSLEDLGYDDENKHPRNWDNPLYNLDSYQNYNIDHDTYNNYDDKYDQYDKYEKYWDNFDKTHFFEDND